MNRLAHEIWHLPRTLLVGLVRIYQWTLSPLIGRQLPFRAHVQRLFHPRGGKIRGHSGHSSRHRAHRPLPSVPSGRLRSAVGK